MYHNQDIQTAEDNIANKINALKPGADQMKHLQEDVRNVSNQLKTINEVDTTDIQVKEIAISSQMKIIQDSQRNLANQISTLSDDQNSLSNQIKNVLDPSDDVRGVQSLENTISASYKIQADEDILKRQIKELEISQNRLQNQPKGLTSTGNSLSNKAKGLGDIQQRK
jgi:hypothetical protein